jgi:hypothetical protein
MDDLPGRGRPLRSCQPSGLEESRPLFAFIGKNSLKIVCYLSARTYFMALRSLFMKKREMVILLFLILMV